MNKIAPDLRDRKRVDRSRAAIVEYINGIEVIKAFNQGKQITAGAGGTPDVMRLWTSGRRPV